MKMFGKDIEGPNEEVIVIPRSYGDIVFMAKAILDYDDFDKLCPTPQPPQIMKPGGETSYNTEDPDYTKRLNEWAQSKTDYMILTSLRDTDGLEWDTIDYSDPETWKNYKTELTSSGFTPIEISRIINSVLTACSLNQDKIDEATKRFLAGRVEQQDKQ